MNTSQTQAEYVASCDKAVQEGYEQMLQFVGTPQYETARTLWIMALNNRQSAIQELDKRIALDHAAKRR